VEKRQFLILPGLELRILGLPAYSQSLYRLRYRGSAFTTYTQGNDEIATYIGFLVVLLSLSVKTLA
jgi:hypothetical protein